MSNKQKGRYSVKNIKALISNGWWAVKLMYSLSKVDTIMITLSIILVSVVPTLSAYVFATLLDTIITSVSSASYSLQFSLQDPVIKLSIIFGLTIFLRRTFDKIRMYYKDRFWVMHSNTIRNNLYLKIASLDIEKFEDPEFADTIQKAKDNLYKFNNFIGNGMSLIRSIIEFTLSGILIFSISPIVGIILIITTIPEGIFQSQYVSDFWKLINENQHLYRKKGHAHSNMTNDKKIYENKTSDSINFLHKVVKQIDKIIISKELAFRTKKFKRDFISNTLSALQNIGLPIFFVYKILSGQFTIGQFSFYLQKGTDFTRDFGNINFYLIDILDTTVRIGDVKKVMEMKNSITSGNKRLLTNKPPKIEFKNVWFKYPRTKQYILKNINLTINPRQEVAFVGENGTGKTTLIKILLRFYDVSKGEILINDIPIQEYDIKSLYKAFTSLFQDYNIYNFATVAENVQFKKRNNKSLKQALKLTGADKFVKNLPHKEQTRMSNKFDDGLNLSKGQEQKIAISRVFTNNAPILILDEPTASIDAVAEHNIFKRIYEFMTDKTVIIISHRFSTVRNAQKIYVLDKGRIVEEGSHDQLIKLKGKYEEAFSLQAQGYTENGNMKPN